VTRKAKTLAITTFFTLSLASTAVALVHQGFQGSIGVGHLQIGASFNAAGKPKAVNRLEWSNVPATCPGPFQISDELKSAMKVDKDGKFHGKGPAVNNSNATVKITGRFKHHGKKAAGTLRMQGSAAGCPDLDTGVVDWSVTKR
jgi:hypothetical protein